MLEEVPPVRRTSRLADTLQFADKGLAYLRASVRQTYQAAVGERTRFDATGPFVEFVACGGDAPRRLVPHTCGERPHLPCAFPSSCPACYPSTAAQAAAASGPQRQQRINAALRQARSDGASKLKAKLAAMQAEAKVLHGSVLRLKAEQAQGIRQHAAAARLSRRRNTDDGDGAADAGSGSDDDDASDTPSASTLAPNAKEGSHSTVLTAAQEASRASMAKEFPRPRPLPTGRLPFAHFTAIRTALAAKSAASAADGGGPASAYDRLSQATEVMQARQARDHEERRRTAEASVLRGVCYATPGSSEFARNRMLAAGPAACQHPHCRPATPVKRSRPASAATALSISAATVQSPTAATVHLRRGSSAHLVVPRDTASPPAYEGSVGGVTSVHLQVR